MPAASPDRLRLSDAEWKALVGAVAERETSLEDRDDYYVGGRTRELQALNRAFAKIRTAARR